jgi:DinB superfamily
MAPQEASDFIESLEKSRQELLAAAASVPEARANTKPESGRWSVLECLEHVTIAEEKLLARLEAAPRLEQVTVDKRKEADLAIRIPNRATRAEAPEAVRPTGQMVGLAEALQRFSAARSRTIQFAATRGADLYGVSAQHFRFGMLNGAEWMVLLAGHARRHAEQIREVKNALGIS